MTSVTFVSDGRNQILVFQEGLFCIFKRQRHRKKYLRELTSESNVHKKSDIPWLYQSKIRNLCISGSQENYKAQIILKNCLHHVIGFPQSLTWPYLALTLGCRVSDGKCPINVNSIKLTLNQGKNRKLWALIIFGDNCLKKGGCEFTSSLNLP